MNHLQQPSMENHRGGSTTTLLTPPQKGRRVLLFPLPFQGHINPMLQLASILHTQGFQITIIHTEFNSPNHSNYPHFTFKSISDGLSKTKNFTVDICNVNSIITFLNESCVEPFRDCLAGLLSGSEEPCIACLITDALWHFTQSVADGLRLPRIVLRTSSLACFVVYAGLLLHRPNKDTQFEAPIPTLAPLKAKDISKILGEIPEGMFNAITKLIKETKKASGLIWNTFKELEQPELASTFQEFPIPSFTIGPFHKYFSASSSSLLEQDRSFFSWLGLQAPDSVLYVSFGSLANLDEAEFIEMAWGLANSKQPFLWVVRPGTVRGSEWLESLPKGFLVMIGERGLIVKWAPQQEVLAHPAIGGFWTHCGWNSTLESICEGVPMICSAFSFDQPINARYVNDVWRIGVLLENGLNTEEIEWAIKRVMVDEEGKAMRERTKFLKEKANLCLEKGGSSYQSVESLVDYILSV